MESDYVFVCTLIFSVLGVLWTKTSGPDIIAKLFLIAMAGWGWFLSLQSAGYVVKAVAP